mmetsp:Transcript_20587/g.42210  ORF Transcript_20587/g.42210 Transcript_20587/m.42210 type:complete len:80 (-) Transcript_20587:100-339(-)
MIIWIVYGSAANIVAPTPSKSNWGTGDISVSMHRDLRNSPYNMATSTTTFYPIANCGIGHTINAAANAALLLLLLPLQI